ncbi:hypothetical protein FLBR109950_00245 [Flavobacterium branchiophilum]|uniref:Uncharacterized protein n=1 Tax=Flavobacterium branchiophilum (strain FL-15) TaxID=1034807 RepID=G2Z5K2_FLABF|nr:hypothetical protein [Flavobacterium branchiophilum]CCB70800.1 Protein of unknown function [Flavobacterium branchiophilum FL-15]
MASVSELGHNKNVANLAAGILILEEMGSLYNPSNSAILLSNLNPIKTELNGTIAVLNEKKPIYKNAVALREMSIVSLSKKTTKSLNYFKSLSVSSTDKENVTNQVKKIRGDKNPKKINPETTETHAISTAQMSYDSRIANLDTYINQLASHPEYVPNETEIQIASLQAYHQELVTASSLVNAAGNALITARTSRNNVLYYNQNNVFKLMQEVKAYLKSLGEAGLPYYKAFVKLKFRNIN